MRFLILISALIFHVTALKVWEVSRAAKALSGKSLVDYVNKNAKWKAGLYEGFTAKIDDRYRYRLGAIRRPPPPTAANPHRRPPAAHRSANLPKLFDAATRWPQCATVINRITDQSSCGSCWAVSATSALSDRLCVASKGGIRVALSALDLLSCCKNCGFGCDGGYVDEAFRHWIRNGIVSGGGFGDPVGCRPYPIEPCRPSNSTADETICPAAPTQPYQCLQHCQPQSARIYRRDRYFGRSVRNYRLDSVGAMIDLVRNGPLVTAFDVYEDFMHYRGGIYEYTAGSMIGSHAVRIVGYGTENGTDYWKVANSWDDFWGENGHFRIKRGTNECTFEEEMTAGTADVARTLRNQRG